MKHWVIEYEIPPLRAIYHAQTEAESEAFVRAAVAEKEPLWRIRKVTPSAELWSAQLEASLEQQIPQWLKNRRGPR